MYLNSTSVQRRYWRLKKLGRDTGSLVVAVLLIAALSLLGIAFTARVFGDLQSAQYSQSLQAARGQAFAGMSDALFRIDQQGLSPVSFCVGPSSECTIQSVPFAPGAQYVAQLVSGLNTTYLVTSEGTSGSTHYAIQATVTRVTDYPFSAFAGSSLTLNGHGAATIQATNQYGTPTGGPVYLGTDGTITCNGGGTDGTGQVKYGGGSNNCPAPIVGTGTYTPQPPSPTCPAPGATTPPTPCMPSGALPCPSDSSGNITGTLEPGVYDCTGTNLNFNGPISVDYSSTANNGQVQIYYFPPSGSSPTLNMTGPINTSETSTIVGNPADLQIYAAGSGTVNAVGSINAILDAPGWGMTVNGSSTLVWTGGFAVNQFTMEGNPTLTINYDVRMSTLLQSNWQESNLTQVAPSSFTLSFT